jgi:hypothetical protein
MTLIISRNVSIYTGPPSECVGTERQGCGEAAPSSAGQGQPCPTVSPQQRTPPRGQGRPPSRQRRSARLCHVMGANDAAGNTLSWLPNTSQDRTLGGRRFPLGRGRRERLSGPRDPVRPGRSSCGSRRPSAPSFSAPKSTRCRPPALSSTTCLPRPTGDGHRAQRRLEVAVDEIGASIWWSGWRRPRPLRDRTMGRKPL